MIAEMVASIVGRRGNEATPANRLRYSIRNATSEAHVRLDAIFGRLDLTTLPGYRTFLEASAAALLPLETALDDANVERIFPDWETRSRRVAILDDIAAVGGDFVQLSVPKLTGNAAIVGTMYVLEGSRLGAQVLLQTVMESPDPLVRSATDYLHHGENLRLWQSFLARLETFASPADEPLIIDGALRAFEMFEQAAREKTAAATPSRAAGHA